MTPQPFEKRYLFSALANESERTILAAAFDLIRVASVVNFTIAACKQAECFALNSAILAGLGNVAPFARACSSPTSAFLI